MDTPDFTVLLNEIQAAIERVAGQQDARRIYAPDISATADIDEKNQAFKNALELLSKPDSEASLDEDGIESFICFFEKLYGGPVHFRHLYSDVCNVMYGFLETAESLDEGIPPRSLALASNMEIIDRTISERSGFEETAKSVRKINDHIQLELIRLEYMLIQNEWQRKTLVAATDASKKADEATKEFQKTIEKSKTESKALLEESKREYITILGIFAAIVIAFTAGSAFSASVLQNIDKASIYRLCMVVVLIGFFLFNLITILLSFISKVSRIDNDKELSVAASKANALFVIAFILIIVARAFDVVSFFR